MLCDYNVEKYVRKSHYEYLNGLTPVKRFAEKFRIATELLAFEVRAEDEIAGWFKFEEDCRDNVQFDDEIPDDKTMRIINMPEKFGSRTNVDRGHTLVAYEAILNDGLIAYEEKIDHELALYPEDEYLTAMKSTLLSVKNFTDRIAGLTDWKLAECEACEKARLGVMRDMLKKVPYYPAENFREAVQSVWIIHFLLPLAENAWYSISLGRFDEYMYPFYKKSLQDGMTRAEAKKILHNLYKLLNSYADGACLLNVGGASYNELSELLIECQKDFALPAPILGARVTEETPEHIWNLLIDEKLFSMGQPTFYGEKPCLHALLEKGVPAEEAGGFSNNSCMGVSIAGNEFNSMWGCVFMVSAALEAALNGGKLLNDKCDIIVPGICQPDSAEEIFENFEKCAGYLLNICAKSYETRAVLSEKTEPDCFVSILTDGCIEKHCDRISGAKYHNVTVECMGMINVSDGIFAVDKLVFQDKKYTLDEVNRAVKQNFEGSEALRTALLQCRKFGENAEADPYAVRVAEILQRLIRSYDHGNRYYSPSLHTLDANVGYGAGWGAGYDGRYAGAPFAKNAGAANEVRTSDPTSMIVSSSALPQYKFFGGQPIDVNFQTDMVRNHKNEIKALVKVYFERGGLQFQVNSLSSKLLRDAADNPEKYPNLVVRIGGYSIYFNHISKASKEEFIERFAKEGF